MCEANAYLVKKGQEELILENVDTLDSDEKGLKMVSIFGEEVQIRAKVKALSLVDHKIVLEPL
ncbi:MAG: CooT family nickel-binding protein [Deltaproteobacteria bacterium]|jgi:predicted RNA-binding protein